MRRFFCVLGCVFLFLACVQAQDDELPPPSSQPRVEEPGLVDKGTGMPRNKPQKIDFSKLIIEPDFTFAVFEAGITVGASPYAGHQVWKNLYAGGGVTYLYTGFKNISYIDAIGGTHYTNANWHTFGAGAFLQYNAWRGLFVRGKFEVLHRIMDDVYDPVEHVNVQNNTYQISLPKIQKTEPDFLLGAGYNLLANRNFFFPVMVSYNVLRPLTEKLYAVYPSGWVVQLGFITVF